MNHSVIPSLQHLKESRGSLKRRSEQIDTERAGTSFNNTETQYTEDLNCIESSAGKVEKITMTNFMCHSNLEINFNHRINFITGRNGSGKSAVMAALIIGLGGAANITGRGSGVAGFIKKGETNGKITLTLFNEGMNSFKREIYGSRIIIVRSFTSTGSNSYQLKSATGIVISKKKEELDRIRLQFNIQIRNPICILNQDVARSFFGATDHSIRFNMFMKATQLEDIKEYYASTYELLVNSQKELDSKKKMHEVSSREIQQLRDKLAAFAAVEKYSKEKKALEDEYLWALVSAEEKKSSELNNQKDKLTTQRDEILQHETNFEEIMSRLNEKINGLENSLKELNEKRTEKHNKKAEHQNEMKNIQRLIEGIDHQMKQLINKNQRQIANIISIKEHLEQNEADQSQNEERRRRDAEKTRDLKAQLSEVKDRITSAQRDVSTADETKIQVNLQLDNANSDVRDMEQRKRNLRVQIEGTKNKETNDLLKYGPYVPKLLQAIDEAWKRNQFKHKPIGPCGMYVHLAGDKKWARAVEGVVGSLMSTFVCDNQADFQVLSRIMDRICDSNKTPTVIVNRFRPRHDVSEKKASARGHLSVLDALTFDNDVIHNLFIDQVRVEGILMFETDEQAASLLAYVQNVPKNLKMGVTMQGDNYYPAPNYRTYCGNNRPSRFFETKMKDVVSKLESELKDIDAAIREKRNELNALRKKMEQVQAFSQKQKANLTSLRNRQRKIEEEINQLKEIEESSAAPQTKVALVEELQLLEKAKQEIDEKLHKQAEEKEKLLVRKNEHAGKSSELGEEEKAVAGQITAVEEELEETKYKLRQQKQKKQGSANRVEEIDRKLSKLADEVEKSSKALEEKLKNASELCPERIETEKPPAEVQQRLERCSKKLKAAQKITGSRSDVIEEFKQKYEHFKTVKKSLEHKDRMVQMLIEKACSKEQRFKLSQNYTANLVSLHFQASLQTRGYDGSLKFDFQRKILDIEVRPRQDSEMRKDSKTLSGGERSYSTVSFILAIWRVVNMPFYFLDEFDVFMDKVNRKVIMDLLLDHAKAQTNMQFVFITPQEISGVIQSDIISIYKMPDPERRKN